MLFRRHRFQSASPAAVRKDPATEGSCTRPARRRRSTAPFTTIRCRRLPLRVRRGACAQGAHLPDAQVVGLPRKAQRIRRSAVRLRSAVAAGRRERLLRIVALCGVILAAGCGEMKSSVADCPSAVVVRDAGASASGVSAVGEWRADGVCAQYCAVDYPVCELVSATSVRVRELRLRLTDGRRRRPAPAPGPDWGRPSGRPAATPVRGRRS